MAALPGMAQAHETADPPTDIDILNYALTLEHLEYAFYRDGLKEFTRLDFRKAFGPFRGPPPRAGLLNVAGSKVFNYFRLIREHEDTHVETLTSVIKSLGGTPVPECRYNFKRSGAFRSVRRFVAVAQVLENTGVTAYDGAIAYIENAKLLTAGATIATVEARHASYLNLLNGDVPFPDAFDTPVAPKKVCNTVKQFIVSCPEPYGPYEDLDALCDRLPAGTIS